MTTMTDISPEELAARIAVSPKAEDLSKVPIDQIPALQIRSDMSNPICQIMPLGSGQSRPAVNEPTPQQQERNLAARVASASPPIINAMQRSGYDPANVGGSVATVREMVPSSDGSPSKVRPVANPFTAEAAGTIIPDPEPATSADIDGGKSKGIRQAGPFTVQHDNFAGQARMRIGYTGKMGGNGQVQEIPYFISATPHAQRRADMSELNPLWDRIYDLIRAYWDMEGRAVAAEARLAELAANAEHDGSDDAD